MAKITVTGESARIAGDEFLTEERVINCYPVVGPDGSRSRIFFRSCLGYSSALATLPETTLRAMSAVNGVLYAVAGGTLFSITTAGVVSTLGAVNDDTDTTISENGTSVTVTAGGTYYVWNGSTLETPGSGRITNAGSVTYIDGYTVIGEEGGDEIEWTTLTDPETRNALFFASAENVNDNVLRVHRVGPNLWAVGEQSIEIFYNTSLSGADAFSRVQGGVMQTGCKGVNLSTVFAPGNGAGETLFWVGDDNVPYMANSVGARPVPRSEGVIAAIGESTPTHCFHYEDRGRKFFVIRFSDRPAWCFDATLGFWHERGTDVYHEEWEVIAAAQVGSTWYAATSLGKIYALANVNKDDTKAMRRAIQFRPFDFGGQQFSVPSLEVIAHSGNADLGRDAQLLLRVKRDGRPWSQEMARSVGDLGEYGTRAVWRALGTQRVSTYEIAISDPADVSIASDANVEVNIG